MAVQCAGSFEMSQKSKRVPAKGLPVAKRRVFWKAISGVTSGYLETLNEYVTELNKHAKLHGIDHVVNKRYHPLERLFWLALVISASYGIFSIGNSQMERYRANPTVISIERGTLFGVQKCKSLVVSKLNLFSIFHFSRSL